MNNYHAENFEVSNFSAGDASLGIIPSTRASAANLGHLHIHLLKGKIIVRDELIALYSYDHVKRGTSLLQYIY